MTEPDPGRPTALPTRGPSLPPSPRPSVASRTSRSSLRRDRERDPDRDLQQQQPQTEHDRERGSNQDAAGTGAPGSVAAPPQTPPFSPLFAIVTSNAHPATAPRRNTHYPTMHYAFADDDPDMLTAALAHHHRDGMDYGGAGGPGAGGGGGGSSGVALYAGDDDDARGSLGVGGGSGRGSGGLGFGGDAGERAVILDVAAAAEDDAALQVAWASSLSPDWAVVSADLSRMEDAAGRSTSPGALMLRIGGVSIGADALPPARMPLSEGDLTSAAARQQQAQQQAQQQQSGDQHQHPTAEDEYAGLLRDFEKRMGVLRRVVESGEERQRALAAEDEAVAQAAAGADEGAGVSGLALPVRAASREGPE